MNKLLAIGFVLLFSYGFVSAQNKPFELFIDAVKNEKGGFSGNKENLSTIFNHERIRLGDKFETELWKYLGNDADKHYWIGSFVSSKSYLQGNSPMSELAIQIYQKAIDLIASKNNESSLGRKVTILRRLAVLSKLLGKQDDAVRFRDQAEAIFAKKDGLGAYIGAQTEYNICIYNKIDKSILDCNENAPPKERIISAGWMNGRAINFRQPEYPSSIKNPRSSARVDVKLQTDVGGNVTSVDIILGPAEFHNAALDAAKKLKFPPTLLSGVPTKVSGWVSFDFRP